ncbi:MAG: alpha/beta fold hydrolase [Gemmatimonadota bacterium]
MRPIKFLLAIAILPSATAAAQFAPEAYSFYTIQGQDTLAIEQVIRTDDQVDVDMLVRQQDVRFKFTLELGPDATVRRVTNRFFRQPQDEEPTQIVTAAFRGDSVDVEISGNRSQTMTVGTLPGALPWIRPSHALLEQALRRSKSLSGTVDSIAFFNIANGQTALATVAWEAPETATIQFAEATISAEISERGAVRGLQFRGEGIRVVREDAFKRLPIEKVDYGAPEGAPYRAEEVTVRTPAGLSLSGTLTFPDPANGKVPGVVTITGSGQQDRDERLPGVGEYRPFWEIADTLARVGIATLRLDDRGINSSDPGPADATFLDFTEDIRAALDYLRSRPEIDGERLALVGHSQGGLIAPRIAAADSMLAGIVLLAAPGYVGRRVLEAQRWADLNPQYVQEHERAEVVERSRRVDAGRAERAPNLRTLMEYDPLPAARRVRVPVLILQGDTDRQVTPEQADTLARAIRSAGNPDVSVQHFPGVNHLLLRDPEGWSSGYASLPEKEISREILGTIADWLADHLERADG